MTTSGSFAAFCVSDAQAWCGGNAAAAEKSPSLLTLPAMAYGAAIRAWT